jgi:NTP pyrophosphatase (non-canonical NTP hydrolase)
MNARTCANCKHNGRLPDGTPKAEACAVMDARDDVTTWAWAHWEDGAVEAGAPACPGFEAIEVPALDLRGLQAELEAWMLRNFGEQTLLERGLCVGEEAGEVQRAILKAHQGIRAGDRGSLEEELPDLIIAAIGTAAVARIDIAAALAKRWAAVRAKTYVREPSARRIA